MVNNVTFEKWFGKVNKESIILYFMGVLVYLPFMTNQLNNADGFTNGVLYHNHSYTWEDAQGRFFLRFFDLWREGMVIPELIVPVSLLMMIVLIYFVWEILDVQLFGERIFIGGFILFSPSVANLFTYYYCADAYSFAFLLAVIASHILIREKNLSFYSEYSSLHVPANRA